MGDINRILIVGYGGIGKRHLLLARQLFPDADIRVIRHMSHHSPPELADGIFQNIEEAKSFSPEVSLIAGPAVFHVKNAQFLAELGSNLLIEKPLSSSLSGVQELLEVVKKNKIILMCGYNLRFLDSLIKFREAIKGGHVGKVLSVRSEVGQYLPSWRSEVDYRNSVSAKGELGGGVLLELSHEIDYLRWIFGDVDWVQASISRQSDLQIDVEDSAHLILGFNCKSNKNQLIGVLNMDFIRHDPVRQCTVIGDNGSIRWDGIANSIHEFLPQGKDWHEIYRSKQAMSDTYLEEWKGFVASIGGKKDLLISAEDGMRVLEVISAARFSSETGCKKYVDRSIIK